MNFLGSNRYENTQNLKYLTDKSYQLEDVLNHTSWNKFDDEKLINQREDAAYLISKVLYMEACATHVRVVQIWVKNG